MKFFGLWIINEKFDNSDFSRLLCNIFSLTVDSQHELFFQLITVIISKMAF